MSQLYHRHFLRLLDFTPAEIDYLLALSAELKHAKKTASETQYLKGKNIALIFEKDSTRTRCSFEVAAYDQELTSRILARAAARSAIKSR